MIKKVILHINQWHLFDTRHYYGMIIYNETRIELVRKVTKEDIKTRGFEGYSVGDETMRFDSIEDLIKIAHKYCKKLFKNYELTTEHYE